MTLLKIDGFGHPQINHLRIRIGAQMNQMVGQDKTASLCMLLTRGNGLTGHARGRYSLSVRKSTYIILLTLLNEIFDAKLNTV